MYTVASGKEMSMIIKDGGYSITIIKEQLLRPKSRPALQVVETQRCKQVHRPIRLTQCCTNSNPLGIKRFVSGISISFKCECHIIMQIQYTKNLIPGRFELGTTLS